jgi:hypothetical protein
VVENGQQWGVGGGGSDGWLWVLDFRVFGRRETEMRGRRSCTAL